MLVLEKVGGEFTLADNLAGWKTKNEGDRFPISVLKISNETGFHPTQKPVALMEYLIKTYTNEGEIVLDFTMGSGTTGVACVRTNRKFIGIEKEKKYFDISNERIDDALVAKEQEIF
jgi:site-specific DNA-methyltransferase (adenine-specific)